MENKNVQCNTDELVFDGGFVVPNPSGGFDAPEINAFGNTFRDYDVESLRNKQVEEFYKMNHIHQTYEFVSIIILLSCYIILTVCCVWLIIII